MQDSLLKEINRKGKERVREWESNEVTVCQRYASVELLT